MENLRAASSEMKVVFLSLNLILINIDGSSG